MTEFNYENIYQSSMLRGYDAYFTRLITLVVEYLERLEREGGDDEAYYQEEHNMLALGYYRHRMEMKDAYVSHDGNLKRMVFDYVAGMSDNFCLDCADEILKPIHVGRRRWASGSTPARAGCRKVAVWGRVAYPSRPCSSVRSLRTAP